MTRMTDITELLKLLERFMAMARERAKTLPYHVNLIETLGGACETEHSRILAAFLRYKTPEGRFELLESLIESLQFRSNIKVERPCIDTEHRHIDIYVREAGKYAIIIENKSNWATDQNQQLARYVEVAQNDGFSNEQIHVLYLPPLDFKAPENQSWGQYKEVFKERYLKLSWRDNLLPWMKDRVLPNVRAKDIPLASALQQYVDYWEGAFGIRGVNTEVEMEMKKTVQDFLKVVPGQDAGTTLNVIREALVNARSLIETLDGMAKEWKAKIELAFWEKLIEALEARGYQDLKLSDVTEEGIVKNYNAKDWFSVGIYVPFKADGRPFTFKCVSSKGNGFYGFMFTDEIGEPRDSSRRNEFEKRLEAVAAKAMPECKVWPSWYGCKPDKAFDFRDMWYETMINRLGSSEKLTGEANKWADIFDGYIKIFTELVEQKEEAQE